MGVADFNKSTAAVCRRADERPRRISCQASRQRPQAACATKKHDDHLHNSPAFIARF